MHGVAAMDDNYVRVAQQEDIAVGQARSVVVGEREILICHTRDGYYALDNLCSHAAARLCEGKLKGNRILCPLHGAAFDVRDGGALSRPATVSINTYPLRLQEDGIYVLIPATEE